jgi:hypothetical protein
MLRQSMLPPPVGLAIGLAGAFTLSQLLKPLLFNVSRAIR